VSGAIGSISAPVAPVVNVTARLASNAATGEVLITETAYTAAGLKLEDLERRQLALKGKSDLVNVCVIRI
jgi:class 3 adenylate cyclase